MPQPRWSDDSVFVCISEVVNLPSQEGDKHQQDAFTATLVLADPIALNVLTFQQSCRFSAMIFHSNNRSFWRGKKQTGVRAGSQGQ